MSTLMIDIEVYNDVLQKVKSYKFRKQVDREHCRTLYSLTDKQAYQLVIKWCKLNELSYVAEYGHRDDVTMDDLYTFIENKHSNRNLNCYQMLKHLKAIRYNIDLVLMLDKGVFLCEGDFNDVKILDDVIQEIMTNIIDEIPEYQAAKYSDPNNFPSSK